MIWWLGEYLEQGKINRVEFLKGFVEKKYGDRVHTEGFLEVDENKYSNEKLLARIRKTCQAKTYRRIAQVLNGLQEMPELQLEEVQSIKAFHEKWREKMIQIHGMREEHNGKITDLLQNLLEDQYPLGRIIHQENETEPVKETYARELDVILAKPVEKSKKDLMAKISDMLKFAEKQHLPAIAGLVQVMAYRFIPTEISAQRNNMGVLVGSDDPVPAIYRIINNSRNKIERFADRCNYDDQQEGVPCAIPIPRLKLGDEEMLHEVVHRVEKTHDLNAFSTSENGYEVDVDKTGMTERKRKLLNANLVAESKLATQRFIYASDVDVFGESLQEILEDKLPALKSYSHQSQESEGVPEVIELNSFLATAGKLFDARANELNAKISDDPMEKIASLVEVYLTEKGTQTSKLPKATDRLKYLKWLNEILKTDKSMVDMLKRHPDLLQSVKNTLDSAHSIALEKCSMLSNLFNGIPS